MQINWISSLVVADFEQVVSYLNLQQIVQHLRLGLSVTTPPIPSELTQLMQNEREREFTLSTFVNYIVNKYAQIHIPTVTSPKIKRK